MDFGLSEREQLLKKTVLEWAEKEITPVMDLMEETGDFPMQLLEDMGKIGLLGVLTPKVYGGTDMGNLARILLLEEVGTVCPAIPMALQVHHMCTYALVNHGSDQQKEKYLPPLVKGETLGVTAITDPSGGSDVAGIQTSAERKGDKYVINGRKCFATNAHNSRIWVVIARTGEGAKGLSAFIVDSDAPGAVLGRKENKVGLRGANTGELVFRNCEVPVENLLGEEGQGMSIAIGDIVNCGRPGMAATALGILGGVIREAAKFATERTLYGKPISKLQAIQIHLADIWQSRELARLATYRVGWLLDQGKRADAESALAKAFACESAAQAARKAIELHGSYGIMKEYAVQRLLRDALVTIPAGGTAEIAKIIMARAALS